MEPSVERRGTDVLVLRRIQQKDEGALAELYDRYGALLFGLMLRMTGERGAAEELLQDVFLTVWRSSAAWDPARGSVQAWLVTIARHRAIDFLRRRPAPSFPLEHEPPASGAAPDEMVVHAVTSGVVREAVDGLPPMYRDVVKAVYYAGLTHRETAELLGIPSGTVKSRIRLAFERLSRRLRSRGVVQ